jgi:hypothetical protein
VKARVFHEKALAVWLRKAAMDHLPRGIAEVHLIDYNFVRALSMLTCCVHCAQVYAPLKSCGT